MSSDFIQKNLNKQNIIFIFLFVFGFIIFMWNNNYTAFWADENFSISMARHTYSEIIDITSNDVHPPLYYCMLRAYCSVAGYSILAIRFFSLLPILLTMILVCTRFRRCFGDIAAIYLMILLIVMPAMLYIVSEIRMYSWAMFWVFCSALSAYILYNKVTFFNCFIYVLSTLGAAYTHNFSLISVFYIYCILFILTWINNKEWIIKLLALGLIIAAFYLPWLIQLAGQMSAVTDSYWIPQITFSAIVGLLHYPYDISYDHIEIPAFVWVVKKLFYVLLILFIIIFTQAQFSKDRRTAIIGNICLLLYILPILTAIAVSILLQPVIIPRYLSCFLVLFFMALSFYLSLLDLSKMRNKILLILLGCVLIIISLTNFYLKRKVTQEIELIQRSFVEYINDNITDKTAFLYKESAYPLGVYATLFPEYKHFAYMDSVQRKDPIHASFLRAFNYTPIANIEGIDSTYTQIFCPENYDGTNQNIMYFPNDSADIVRLFEIKEKITVGLYQHPLYRLERRKNK